MRWLLVFVAFATAFLPVLGDSLGEPKFASLKDALSFLDRGLDAKDWSGLNNALYPSLRGNEPNRTCWRDLEEGRGKLNLASIFADQDFPTSGDNLLLRVPHDVSIGGTRVRFIKTEGAWHLNAVYIVR